MPKVNLVSILAGALTLVSITLPWWGADGPLGVSARLSFFTLSGFTDEFDQALSQIMLVFVVFVVTVAAVGLVGSIYERNSVPLLGSSCLSTVTAILYALVLDNAFKTYCQGSGSDPCINVVIGSNYGASWGFQTGFYLFVASGVLYLVAAIFHGYFMLPRSAESVTLAGLTQSAGSVCKTKYCSECGSSVLPTAKFCSNCASPLNFSRENAVFSPGRATSER